MPTLIWSKVKDGLDPSMKRKAYAFFEKLQENDTTPGLHIEPIRGSIDDRVRTGRVDDNFRCVLFKIVSGDEPVYVIHGVWPHDKANSIAERVQLSMNPINGVPEVRRVMQDFQAAAQAVPVTASLITPARAPTPRAEPSAMSPDGDVLSPTSVAPTSAAPAAVLDRKPEWADGVSSDVLHSQLGIDAELATAALAAMTESQLMDVIGTARVEWQADALLELATGTPVPEVRETFRLDEAVDTSGTEDERLLRSLARPAAQMSFHEIKSDDELRRIIDAGDFGAWRLFLHPEQRKYVDSDYRGPFRLSGGAGTGKTVVAVHRAHRLAQSEGARVLLTTYTRNLADDLAAQVLRLDERTIQPTRIGHQGLLVKGIDALAWSIIQQAGPAIEGAAADVLGAGATTMLKNTPSEVWREAIADSGVDLPPELGTPTFFEAEYGLVILPSRVTSEREYVRVRRQGRGTALDRAKRVAVWKVVETYRAKARAAGSSDFEEKAAVAAAWLDETGDRPFDHVVVDEAQDLTPSHLRLLRALTAPGENDIFMCEDSHQRIYGQKVTLSHYGIAVRGRSRRLTLNYRTTAQNLDWAMRILSGAEYTDLEGEAEKHTYHSSRSGPAPLLLPARSMSEELTQAAELVQSWLPAKDGSDGRAPSPEAIAILVRDRYRRENVVSGLADHGLDMRSVDREPVRAGKPLVMTMHRAKGLEFTHVLLFDIQEGSIPRRLRGLLPDEDTRQDILLRERSLVYVAATRARDVLAVSWHGESSNLIQRAVP